MNDAWGNMDENAQPAADAQGNGLRSYIKSLEENNKKAEERLQALEAKLNAATVADILEAQGVSRSAVKFYNGEPDPEKVAAFVTDIRSAFSGAAPAPDEQKTPVLNSDTQNQYQRMNEAGSGGAPVGNADAAKGELSAATSTADLIAAMANLQARQQS